MVTGSRPSLAQQVLIGITISAKGEGAGKGEGTRPLSVPASFALVLPLLSSPFPPQSMFLLSVFILSIFFHFSCTGCICINNCRPRVSPHPQAPARPGSLFPFCLPLEASYGVPHPFILASFHLYFKIENKVLKGQRVGEMKCEGKGKKGGCERQGRTIKSILVFVRGEV